MKVLSNIRVLLIGLWLGAACFFSFAVAPSAFAVLPTRDLAGSVVSRTLAIVNISGLIIGLILLASSFVRQIGANRLRLLSERALLVIFTIACGVGQFVIALWLAYVRSQIGRPVDELAVEDPLRIRFNDLHQYSVWVMLAAMLTALVLFFVMAQNSKKIEINENDVIKQNV
jgi:hypothetical protein